MDLGCANESFIEATQQSSGSPAAAGSNDAIMRRTVTEIDLSQDLLQQAFQEVTPATTTPDMLQVKEEVPELLDRVDLLTTPPLTVNTPATTNGVSLASSSAEGPHFENKIKMETQLPLSILQGISTITPSSSSTGPVIFVPNLQVDGGVAYTAVQPRQGLTTQQQTFGIQSEAVIQGSSAGLVSINVLKPTDQSDAISQTFSPKPKPKTILPKSSNAMKTNFQYHLNNTEKSPVKLQPSLPTILRKPQGTSVRRVQLITGNNGQHCNIEIITKNGETSIKSDQHLSPLEVKHVQSIIQHQKDFKGTEGERQVYQVVYPTHVQPPTHSSSREKDDNDRMIEGKESAINVQALVSQIKRKGNGKARCRGRPRKGTPKIINEKKVYKELKKELGVREVRVKELGLMDREEDYERSATEFSEDVVLTTTKSRTRSGRLTRPPHRIQAETEEAGEEIMMSEGDVSASGPITNMNNRPPPKVDSNIPNISLPYKRNFVPPEKYICKVCGKLYLGDKKIAKHLKHFPSHEFAAPDPPLASNIVKEVRKTANVLNTKSFESLVSDYDPNSFLDQVGPSIFKSFSMWDLLVKKTIFKKLGTKESLTSLFADMQAIVMELRNLVEQCLSCERTDDEGPSVSLTPIMSSVLGLSQSGGVTRYVLPSTMIPQHYHQLLNLQTCVKTLNDVSSSTDHSLMSPESTNSILPPDEENSQMSLSSDILDQPLGDKVVLEDNLGARPMDMDEETQDSSIAGPSPVISRKRTRLDSESHSAISPPPRTPDFLSQGDDSNMSSISIVTVSEPSRDVRDNDTSVANQAKRICSNIDTDCNTKLPSFSSLVNGSPKPDSLGPSEVPVCQPNANVSSNSSGSHHSNSSDNAPSSVYETNNEAAVVTTSYGISSSNTSSSNPLMRLQESFGISTDRAVTLAGSAPVSPRVNYSSSNTNQNLARRCSLDNIARTAPENMLLGLGSKLQESGSSLLDILNPSVTDNNPLSSISVTSFPMEQQGEAAVSDTKVASTIPQYQRSEEGPVSVQFGARVTEWQQPQAINCGKRTSNEENVHSASDLEQNVKTGILKPSPVEPFLQKTPTNFSSGSSTHVTFSDELSHPIPSVSPAKDFREIDLKRQNPTPPSESQSSSIFSDLESVLNEASDFAFHNELSSVDRSRVKTPEKQLLASVPPQVIMEEKPSASISFNNILELNKVNSDEKCVVQSNNEEPASLPNIQDNPPNFTFPNSNDGVNGSSNH